MRLGKNKQAVLLAVLLAFFLLSSASAEGQTGRNFKYHLDGDLQESNVISEGNKITINYSASELTAESFKNNYGAFYRISIPGHTHTSIPGKPELPVYSSLISIPYGSDYKVKISEIRSTKIRPSRKKIDGKLFPAQMSQTKVVQQRVPDFKIDKEVYEWKGIISSDTVSIEPLGTVRNRKLANLYVFPARYNPESNILEVITSMKIEIIFSDTKSSGSKSLIPESNIFNSTLAKGVLNYNPEDVVPGFSDQPVKMVILTDTSFRKHLEPFFRWKTQKGFKLQVLYRGTDLAGNTYAQLKDTLTKIYNGSSETDPAPEYLLIIGDITIIPTLSISGNLSDMYYGEFDGNGDYIPEMFIGRIPVSDTTELKNVIKKLIQYEKFEFAGSNNFYSRALASSGNDGTFFNIMNGQVKYAIDNYLNLTNKITEYHFYYPIANTTKNSIINLVNNGLSFLNYTGHGQSSGLLLHSNTSSDTSNIYVSDTARFKNKNMYPFVISNACKTGSFHSASSIGNRLLLSGNKGAIGFIGCSNDSYWDEDFYWAVGPGTPSADPTYQSTGLGALDRLFHTHGEPASDWYFTMGQVNYSGNMSVSASASTSTMKRYYWETYNLIGDPSVIPITGKPDSFNITVPDTLPNGIKSLYLTADPFAYLAVTHLNTLWDASFAGPSGSVLLNLPGVSDDSCLIVITGQNKIPLIKTIYFSEINGEFINLASSSINDSPGNNDGKADISESLYLNITVSNLGSTDASGLSAEISSTSEWVTINNASVNIGTLPAGSQVVLPDDLAMTIADNVPDMGVINIDLKLKDLVSEKHFPVEIVVHAPVLQIVNCIIDDSVLGNGDYIADPGETFYLVFKVLNQGTSDINGQFTVICQDEELDILEPSVKSGLLRFGEITDIYVKAKATAEALSGSFITVESTLDCTPFLINEDFSLRIGKIRESFEAASFNIFPWINVSVVPWIISQTTSSDGSISARSGSISHDETSKLKIRTLYTKADTIKFSYKVSSESKYDNLLFNINGSNYLKKSGEIPWTKIAIPVQAGLNDLEWTYEKDESILSGADCAWIDMIDFAISSSVNYIQRDIQVVEIVSPYQKDQLSQESVTVKLLNTGRDIINGFNLAYKVNENATPVYQFFENSLFPEGDTLTVSFKVKADMSKYGLYEIIAYSYNNNDDYVMNDTSRVKINKTEIQESVSLFPNPFTDRFTLLINSAIPDKVQISITSTSGVRMHYFEREILSGKNTLNFANLGLSPSVYYLKILGTTINITIPVINLNK